jgi:hypothetical protein
VVVWLRIIDATGPLAILPNLRIRRLFGRTIPLIE